MTKAGHDTEAKIRVLIVDDHPLVRDGIAALIEKQPDMSIAAEAADGGEAVTMFARLSPDITVMDLQMPGMDGIGAIMEIRKASPTAAIIVLTTYPGDARAMQALHAGAAGYLLKSSVRTELTDAIRSVHAGSPAVSAVVAHDLAIHALDDRLTDREVEILKLVAEGLPNRQIGLRLRLSTDTIKARLKHIFVKLDAEDRTHAVTLAARRGYIER